MERFVLWNNIWFILESVLYVLVKNVYSAVVRQNVLYMAVRFIWSIVLFKPVSLLILSGWLILLRVAIKVPNYYYISFISPFSCISFWLVFFRCPDIRCKYLLCYIFLLSWPLYHYIALPACLFFFNICWKIYFHPSHSMGVFKAKWVSYCWIFVVVVVYPFSHYMSFDWRIQSVCI